MTADPAKDAERLADIDTWLNNDDVPAPPFDTFSALCDLREMYDRLTRERDDLRDSYNELYAGAQRLQQERDEARRSAAALQEQLTSDYGGGMKDGLSYGERDTVSLPAVAAQAEICGNMEAPTAPHQDVTQPSAADVERARPSMTCPGCGRAYPDECDWCSTTMGRPDTQEAETALSVLPVGFIGEAITLSPVNRRILERKLRYDIAAALTAARREERELRALDEAVIAEAHKTVQQVGATRGLIDALAARDAAIRSASDARS